MSGLAEPKPSVEELRKQLKEAEDEQKKMREDASKAIKPEWRYVVTWKSAYRFYCHRELTESCKIAIENWEQFYGGSHPAKPFRGIDAKEGMEYVLINDMLVQVSGGTLVLKASGIEGDNFSHEPRKLTKDQESALREGIVPHSLKMYG